MPELRVGQTKLFLAGQCQRCGAEMACACTGRPRKHCDDCRRVLSNAAARACKAKRCNEQRERDRVTKAQAERARRQRLAALPKPQVQAGPPLCLACGEREVKPGRNFCHRCYRKGVRSEGGEGLEVVFAVRKRRRRALLIDTGMMIDDALNELILPDGTHRFPVPSHLSLTCWFEEVRGKPNLLRVYRAAPETANAQST